MHRNSNTSIWVVLEDMPVYLILILHLVPSTSCYISKSLSKTDFIYYHHRCSCCLWNQFYDFLKSCLNIKESTTFQLWKDIDLSVFFPQILRAGKLCQLPLNIVILKFKRAGPAPENRNLGKLRIAPVTAVPFSMPLYLGSSQCCHTYLQPWEVPLRTVQSFCLPVYVFTPNH